MSDIIIEKSYTCNFLPTMLPGLNFYRYYSIVDPILRDPKYDRVIFNHPVFDPNGQGRFFEMDMFQKETMEELFNTWLNQVCEESDVVIVQRLLTKAGLAILDTLKECNIKIITEIDDSYKIQPYQNAYRNYYPGSEPRDVFIEQVKMSDAIMTTQGKIKKLYEEFNKDVFIIKNGIWYSNDTIKSMLDNTINKSKDGPIKIIWCGSSTHDKDLLLIYPELLKIKDKYKDKVMIKLMGGVNNIPQFNQDDGIIKQYINTNVFNYYKILSNENAHIGLAPLCENEFNTCKSNLRFLEYSALNMVTVASNVYPFKEDINSGHCLSASNLPMKNSFSEVLSNLIDSGIDNIISLGKNASEYVKNNYDTSLSGDQLYSNIIRIMNKI